MGDPGSIPGSGRSPGEGSGSHSSVLAWRVPWTKVPEMNNLSVTVSITCHAPVLEHGNGQSWDCHFGVYNSSKDATQMDI